MVKAFLESLHTKLFEFFKQGTPDLNDIYNAFIYYHEYDKIMDTIKKNNFQEHHESFVQNYNDYNTLLYGDAKQGKKGYRGELEELLHNKYTGYGGVSTNILEYYLGKKNNKVIINIKGFYPLQEI